MLSFVDRDRIARGAALLDEEMPGWAEKISLEILDINDSEMCILAQLYGSFYGGGENLGLFTNDKLVENGFFPEKMDDTYYKNLKNEAWAEEIAKRS